MSAPKKGDLSSTEKELFQVITAGNTQEASRLLGCKDVRVNCLDEYGMTPLMHCCLQRESRHVQVAAATRSGSLMFAGLSGKTDITWMMLDAGAETDVVNSVEGPPHKWPLLSGNTTLDYYSKLQGLEKEPKLPSKLAGPLHKVIMSTNLNPVKMVMLVKENPLVAEAEALRNVAG
ncbi:hypothetical protein KUCAC02_014291 [Chaenocephalus aceratus]|uniref:Uncharacterized protein n=1 Tax=Chaenocephalus aceratus TaxID=36190 RepID=A0ACB9WE84_CHAAC|nr:hypothetical protein KUCAC02_014291 [Chaenocephalus aceratus]